MPKLRSLRSLAALAALFVAPLPACAVSGADEAPAPVAQQAQALEVRLDTVSSIVADPKFLELRAGLLEAHAPVLRAMRGMTPDQRRQFVAGLASMSCTTSACPSLVDYFAAAGIPLDPSKLAALSAQLQALLARGATKLAVSKALLTANGQDYVLGVADAGAYPSGDAYGACIDDCAAEFAITTYTVISGYVSELAACALLTGPAIPLCVAAATASYAWELSSANSALQGCKDRCEEQYASTTSGSSSGSTGSTLGRKCQFDTDCAAAEYCTVAWQGLGYGKCESDEGNGTFCVRNGWCKSSKCSWGTCSK